MIITIINTYISFSHFCCYYHSSIFEKNLSYLGKNMIIYYNLMYIQIPTVRGTATFRIVQINRSYVRILSVLHRIQQNLNWSRVALPNPTDLVVNKKMENYDREHRLENRLQRGDNSWRKKSVLGLLKSNK